MIQDSPIHNWFGLTHAAWLTIPRVFLEDMPFEWQTQIVDLLNRLDATYQWPPLDVNIHVQLRSARNGNSIPMPEVIKNYGHPEREWLRALRIDESEVDDER